MKKQGLNFALKYKICFKFTSKSGKRSRRYHSFNTCAKYSIKLFLASDTQVCVEWGKKWQFSETFYVSQVQQRKKSEKHCLLR